MILHIIIISLECTALAAFLILWYFWVRKRVEVSYLLEDEDQLLFPFRYFSWILIGLVVVTSVAQIHFVRVSSQVHERMAAMSAYYKNQSQQAKAVDDLKGAIDKIRRDMEGNFKGLRTQLSERYPQGKSFHTVADVNPQHDRAQDKEALIRIEKPKADVKGNVFAKEAKASSSAAANSEFIVGSKTDEEASKDHSMLLNRQAKVLKDQVRVRKRPQPDSPPIERLMSGQQVKVTEKRLDSEGKIWFRVITPSGRAGWIDFRYVKLEGNA